MGGAEIGAGVVDEAGLGHFVAGVGVVVVVGVEVEVHQ